MTATRLDQSPRPRRDDRPLPGVASRVLAPRVRGGGTRAVAVASGKGGVGKSHVALHLAAGAASWGLRPLLVDADVGMACQDLLLKVRTPYDLGHVVRGEARLADALVQAPGGITLLASPTADTGTTSLTPAERWNLHDALDAVSQEFDLVVVDTGAGVAGDSLPLCARCQEILIVTSPEPAALRDAYAVMKLLSSRYGEHRFSLVVNGVSSPAEGASVHRRLGRVVGQFLPVALDHLGSLPADPAVPAAARKGEPLYLTAPWSPFAAAARDLATRLLERPAPSFRKASTIPSSRWTQEGPEQ